MRKTILALTLLFVSHAGLAGTVSDRFFTSRDGLRLHYLEAGSGPRTIVFIPGWLMPAAVFRLQLEALGNEFRVLAFDPRSQGKSEVYNGAHSVATRMDDMEDFLSAAGVQDYVLAGWSLGALESLDFVERKPQAGLRGLIIIDNSIGEGDPPPPRTDGYLEKLKDERRKQYLTDFCQAIFGASPPADIAAAVLSSALQVPAPAAIQLISQPYPRTYWRDIVAKQQIPVLYTIRPYLSGQGDALLQRKGPLAQVRVFSGAGHALFVDEASMFNATTASFARRCFLPGSGTSGGQSGSSAPPSLSDN